uniref:Putative secreted protein n=1 Tax=Anopheles darlingi TaxID=43151 RepID=A0A2M4D1U8_ANODA
MRPIASFGSMFASFITPVSTAVSKVSGVASRLQHIPASIFGSIISIADIASSNPNIESCTSSPSSRSLTQSKKSVVTSCHWYSVSRSNSALLNPGAGGSLCSRLSLRFVAGSPSTTAEFEGVASFSGTIFERGRWQQMQTT